MKVTRGGLFRWRDTKDNSKIRKETKLDKMEQETWEMLENTKGSEQANLDEAKRHNGVLEGPIKVQEKP